MARFSSSNARTGWLGALPRRSLISKRGDAVHLPYNLAAVRPCGMLDASVVPHGEGVWFVMDSSKRPHPPTTHCAPASRVKNPRPTSTTRTGVLIGLILYFSYHLRPLSSRRSPRIPHAQSNPHRFTVSVHRPRKKPASSFARSQSCFNNRLICLANRWALFSRTFGSTTFMVSRIFMSSGSNGLKRARNSLLRRDNAVASPRRMASCTNNACALIFSRHLARSAVM